MKLVLAALVTVAAAFGLAEQGRACSRTVTLMPLEPRALVANADAAFVGTLIDVRRREPLPTPVGPGPILVSNGDPHVFTYVVEERLKGDLPERVEVVSPLDGGLCGLRAELGKRVGLLLQAGDGVWRPSTLDTYDPEFLKRGLLPLPAPTGSGPPRLVAGGAFGEARVATLDSRGQVLSYGAGRGVVTSVSLCPGGGTLVELAKVGDGVVLGIRRLPGLGLIRETQIASTGSGSNAVCRDRSAADALVVVRVPNEQAGEDRLLRVTPIGTSVLETADGLSLATRGAKAVVSFASGDVIVRDLARETRRLAERTAGLLRGTSVSPDGRFLVGFGEQELTVVDLARRTVRSRARTVGYRADTRWIDSRRFAAWTGVGNDGQIELLNPAFRKLRPPILWTASVTALTRRGAFGVDRTGVLLSAKGDGYVDGLGKLFSPAISILVALPSS